ncbi:MAG: nitroreductase family protein [Candidatus Thermoplasmatota archaeon]
MEVEEAIVNRRSIRRFKRKTIDLKTLQKLVNAGRLAPSAANLQPLRFLIVNKKDLCRKIFENIGWAGYLKDWNPSLDEQPAAYIILLNADEENKWESRDAGLASSNIVLQAESLGIGSCILCNIDRKKIRDILNIPKNLLVDSVIALGYKDEVCIADEMKDTVKYWRDKQDVVHVPKRKMSEVMYINQF